MAKTQQFERGTFLRVPLPDGSFGYGRTVDDTHIAFYDRRTEAPSDDLDDLESRRVLFTQAVRKRDLRRWQAIGVRKLAGEVAKPVVAFMQDLADPSRCTVFDTAGMQRSATPEECVGIERAAVWEPHQVERRLLDTFLGRPNDDERRMRVRLPPFDDP